MTWQRIGVPPAGGLLQLRWCFAWLPVNQLRCGCIQYMAVLKLLGIMIQFIINIRRLTSGDEDEDGVLGCVKH